MYCERKVVDYNKIDVLNSQDSHLIFVCQIYE